MSTSIDQQQTKGSGGGPNSKCPDEMKPDKTRPRPEPSRNSRFEVEFAHSGDDALRDAARSDSSSIRVTARKLLLNQPLSGVSVEGSARKILTQLIGMAGMKPQFKDYGDSQVSITIPKGEKITLGALIQRVAAESACTLETDLDAGSAVIESYKKLVPDKPVIHRKDQIDSVVLPKVDKESISKE